MATVKEQIEIYRATIRDRGNTEPLFIVPVVAKRCFAPCGAGACNCYPTIDHRWTLVDQTNFNAAMDEWFNEVKWLQDHVDTLD